MNNISVISTCRICILDWLKKHGPAYQNELKLYTVQHAVDFSDENFNAALNDLRAAELIEQKPLIWSLK